MYCSNVEGLLARLIAERGLNPDLTDIHVGCDGGQGSLKLGLIVTDRSKEEKVGRAFYSQVKFKFPNIFKINTIIFILTQLI